MNLFEFSHGRSDAAGGSGGSTVGVRRLLNFKRRARHGRCTSSGAPGGGLIYGTPERTKGRVRLSGHRGHRRPGVRGMAGRLCWDLVMMTPAVGPSGLGCSNAGLSRP